MFVGHYCAAFVAKRIEPRLRLWTVLLAVQLVDVFWGLFILLGIEQASLDPALPGNPLVLSYMPYTHSLPATLLWSAAAGMLGALLWARGEYKLKLGMVLAATVASHWFLDLLVHRHDLGLWGDAHKVGLALWDQPMAAYALEVLLLAGSVVLLAFSDAWLASRRSALAVLCIGLLFLQTASQFGAIPESLDAMVLSALFIYLLVPAAGRWAERVRR